MPDRERQRLGPRQRRKKLWMGNIAVGLDVSYGIAKYLPIDDQLDHVADDHEDFWGGGGDHDH